MNNAEIMNITKVCSSFPIIEKELITREHIINTIEMNISGELEILFIEGIDGIGKTTILYQFALLNSNRCFSLFIRPASRWSYDPVIILRDLANQMTWYLYGKELSDEQEVDISYLRNCYSNLCKKARSRKEDFYFIIDGVLEIPENNEECLIQILDLLPIGLYGFKFLISGDRILFPKDYFGKISNKSLLLVPFTQNETQRFLEGLDIKCYELEIFKTLKGIPEHLNSLKRILESGTEIENIIDDLPQKLPDLFEIEWGKLKKDESISLALGILAFDHNKHTVPSLAKVLHLDNEILFLQLNEISFVEIDNESLEINFVSETFRKFARKKLQNSQKQVFDVLIDDLLKSPQSKETLLLLPDYYNDAERYDELLLFLSPENLLQVLECSKSISPLRQQASLGIEIAKKEKRDFDLLRFCAEKSIILGTEQLHAPISQLEALIILEDYQKASSLAQKPVLKEDLLQSLAIYAKAKLSKDGALDQEIVEQIHHLYPQIDNKNLGKRGLEIAADLIFSAPDLAVDLVENSLKNDSTNESVDLAIANLSLAAAFLSEKNGDDIYEKIRKRINNPRINNITSVASLLIGDTNADTIIAEAEKFDNPMEGLFLLRLWTTQKCKNSEAIKVIDYSIKKILQISEYTPNARDFRQLATPLPFIQNKNELKELIGKFDNLKTTLERFGPSEDYVRLQLLIAEAELTIDKKFSNNRILELYLYFILNMKDLAIKGTCLARMISSLHKIDPDNKLEQDHQFSTLISKELENTVDQLLNSTGDHYQATKRIINALSKKQLLLAYSISNRLNLEERREKAKYDLLQKHIKQPIKDIDFDSIQKILDEIVTTEFRDDLLLDLMINLERSVNEIDSNINKKILPLINQIDNITSPSTKSNALGMYFSIISKMKISSNDGLRERIKNNIDKAWMTIDDGWIKVDFGFKIAETFAQISKSDGYAFFNKAEEFKSSLNINEETIENVYLYCINLAIRSFYGLIRKNNETTEDFDRIHFAIDLIPSTSARISLWGNIAAGYILNNRVDYGRKIVTEYIRPNLASLHENDKRNWENLIISLSPVLFSVHVFSAYEEINKLNHLQKDTAYTNICQFIFQKCNINDPYDYRENSGFSVTYEETLTILDVISRMEVDGSIFSQFTFLADSITSSEGRQKFTREQKNDITKRMYEIIDAKLPDKKNITHQGFKIACLAQVYRIGQISNQQWLDLKNSTDQIPNISDRVFVLGLIANSMPNRMSEWRIKTIEIIEEIIEEIPSLTDKLDRYEEIARYCLDIDQNLTKRFLNLGIKNAILRDDKECLSAQRRIIDLAYSSVNADFAASLASISDDDQARKIAKENLASRIKLQKIKQEIIDKRKPQSYTNEDEYIKISWMLLSSLNADRVKTFSIDELRHYIEIGSRIPIERSYIIFTWIIQNIVNRYGETDQARTIIRSVFTSIITATELSGRMAKCGLASTSYSSKNDTSKNETSYITVKSGERQDAILFIKNWIEDNVEDYIKIHDPYFCISDLEVLLLIMDVKPNCKVYISTSKKQQSQENISQPWDDAYRLYWKLKLSDQIPPDCEIVIVGSDKTGDHPIHDRWWVTKSSGLKFGSSYKSIGLGKETDISKISKSEAEDKEYEIDRFLIHRIRDYDGERINYTTFSL